MYIFSLLLVLAVGCFLSISGRKRDDIVTRFTGGLFIGVSVFMLCKTLFLSEQDYFAVVISIMLCNMIIEKINKS